jgi:outer membrane protein
MSNIFKFLTSRTITSRPIISRKKLLRLIGVLCLTIFFLSFGGSLYAQKKSSPGDDEGERQSGQSGQFSLVPPLPGEQGLTIAVIDMGKAIEDSNEGKRLQERFKGTFELTNTKMKDKGDALEKKVNDFNKNQASMSTEERERAQNSLRKELEDYNKETQKASDEFKASVEKAMDPLIKKAETIVQDLSKSNNYLAVVENGTENAIIYADTSLSVVDITAEVTNALNSQRR